MKNIHFMFNSGYTNSFIDVVNKERPEEENLFLVARLNNQFPIEVQKHKNIQIIDHNDTLQWPKIYEQLSACERIFIHHMFDALGKKLYPFLKNHKGNKTLYWGLWGSDIYPYISMQKFEDSTANWLKHSTIRWLNNKSNFSSPSKAVIEQVDYFLTWNPGDYKILKNSFTLTGELMAFVYPLNLNVKKLFEMTQAVTFGLKKQLGVQRLVFIGNSSSPQSNHLDVLYKLQQLKTQDFAIICPLNYGYEAYKKAIIEYGKKLFGTRFYPLVNFIAPDDYTRLLNEVDVFVMNHRIQQGAGTNISALLLGKKLYMNKHSNVYGFFKEKGLEVYDIEDIQNDTFFEMDETRLNVNRQRTYELFNEEKIIEQIVSCLVN